MKTGETFFYGQFDFTCKQCATSMDEIWNGKSISELFSYCPACGRKILGFYETEEEGDYECEEI